MFFSIAYTEYMREEIYVRLRVRADAGEDCLKKKSADLYEISVTAPAERGLANARALALLAKALGVAAGRLAIVKGAHCPSKIIKYYK